MWSDWEKELEESFKQHLGVKKPPSPGEKVKGKVILVGSESIFVDIGLKQDAFVERSEYEALGLQIPKVGEEVELFVISYSGGQVRLGKAIRGGMDIIGLREAFQNKVPVEGKVLGTRKGGYLVSIGDKHAFCPSSQISLVSSEEPAAHVGKTYNFIITEMDGSGKNLVVSRREALVKELKERQEAFIKALKIGDVVKGVVRSIVPYGVFVEIGPNVQGLLHISELSWSRIRDPKELVQVGETLELSIKELQCLEDGNYKISLSLKDMVPDPWKEAESRFQIGDVVKGKVTRLVPYGAFVDIGGLEGLVHISEMSYTKRVLKPQEIVSEGQEIKVMIKALDIKEKRISLSIKEVEGDPWADVLDRFQVGQIVEGIVTKKMKDGYLVHIYPGITGYLSMRKLDESPLRDQRKLREQDRIRVKILEIHPKEKRILLDLGVEEADMFENVPRKEDNGSFGTLGDYLRKALGK